MDVTAGRQSVRRRKLVTGCTFSPSFHPHPVQYQTKHTLTVNFKMYGVFERMGMTH
jgi:hypothetical protein